MATANLPATTNGSIESYVNRIAASEPQAAVQIALAEAERQKALAQKAHEEYRAMSEIEFDATGRIVRANMGGLYRLARMYASSTIVPKHYQGSEANCFIATQMAFRMKVDPMMLMQSSYIVHGKPGLEAKFAIAMLNTSGKIKGRLKFEYTREKSGKALSCKAIAIDAESGDEVAATVTWDMVQKEGWAAKDGSKWLTIPDQMFGYRSAVFLIRLSYPEVLMGMQTVDELEDIANDPATLTAKPIPRNLDDLTERYGEPKQIASGGVESTAESSAEPEQSAAAHPLSPASDTLDKAIAAVEAATSLADLDAALGLLADVQLGMDDEMRFTQACDAARERIKAAKKK